MEGDRIKLVPQPVWSVPLLNALRQRRDRTKRPNTTFRFPSPLDEVIDNQDPVAARRKIERRRPTEIAVSAEDDDPHWLAPRRAFDSRSTTLICFHIQASLSLQRTANARRDCAVQEPQIECLAGLARGIYA